jgi:hypothetical protein
MTTTPGHSDSILLVIEPFSSTVDDDFCCCFCYGGSVCGGVCDVCVVFVRGTKRGNTDFCR